MSHVSCQKQSGGQSDGPSWWRVCYQQGLPRRLVFNRPSVAGAVLQTPLLLIE